MCRVITRLCILRIVSSTFTKHTSQSPSNCAQIWPCQAQSKGNVGNLLPKNLKNALQQSSNFAIDVKYVKTCSHAATTNQNAYSRLCACGMRMVCDAGVELWIDYLLWQEMNSCGQWMFISSVAFEKFWNLTAESDVHQRKENEKTMYYIGAKSVQQS